VEKSKDEELVRIEIVSNNDKKDYWGKLGLRLVDHGIWEGDNKRGKKICLIELKFETLKGKFMLNFPTSHDFCDNYIDKMLQAEYDNDHFQFEPYSKFLFQNFGTKSKTRPRQLGKKIERIVEILKKWLPNGMVLAIKGGNDYASEAYD